LLQENSDAAARQFILAKWNKEKERERERGEEEEAQYAWYAVAARNTRKY